MSAKKAASAKEIRYGDAVEELERILEELEADSLDVDVLASRVERASVLIQLCRDRIGSARIQVEKVVASLDEGSGAEPDYPEVATLDLDADGG